MTCVNCGLADEACRGTVDDFWTDDGRKLPLCAPCAAEERRLELLADHLAESMPECISRQLVIESSSSTRQLVNRLRAHELWCPTCRGVVELPARPDRRAA